MTDDQIKELLRLAQALEHAARQLRLMAQDAPGQVPRPKSSTLPVGFVDELRAAERAEAAAMLASLSRDQLGEVFVQLRVGSSRGSKRSKDWLREKILWHLFDFKEGHDIIRGSK
jgi:hypothetical protein